MKTLATLGAIAGGFLMNPPPKAVLTTVLWVASRSHPVVAALMLLAFIYASRSADD